MGGDEAGCLLEGHVGTAHDEGHQQHGVREVWDGNRDDEDGDFAVPVVLRVGVG